MQQEIQLVFHKRGMRSFIEVDLCRECPRQDDKGCCGHYSPVFYPTDLLYLHLYHPGFIDRLFSLPRLTVLDHSVTVNSFPDGDGSSRCQFHSRDQGCLLSMLMRESVCRHFVCPGIGWWDDPQLQKWKDFYDRLEEYEIQLNHAVAAQLGKEGLSLRNPDLRSRFMSRLEELIQPYLFSDLPFGGELPETETCRLTRPLSFGREWPL